MVPTDFEALDNNQRIAMLHDRILALSGGVPLVAGPADDQAAVAAYRSLESRIAVIEGVIERLAEKLR